MGYKSRHELKEKLKMWIPSIDWSNITLMKESKKLLQKLSRVEKIEKSIKSENDLQKRRHRQQESFSSILIDVKR